MREFREAKLSNGLRIAAEVDRRSYSAAIGYFVQAGSRNEVDAESGLSHFLEHMMFKGTKQSKCRRRQSRAGRIGWPKQRLHQRGTNGLLRNRACRSSRIASSIC